MRAFRVYMHPRTWRRRLTISYHRFTAGRSSSEKIPPLERQLLRHFYDVVQNHDAKLFHYVNGVFAKEVVLQVGVTETIFRIVDNESKVFFMKKGGASETVIQTYVTPKTALVMNRIFDKEFDRMYTFRKELEIKAIRNIFAKI